MIRKTIIVVLKSAERSEDDWAPVFSPSGAAENSPGLQSGDGERLENSLSPVGANPRSPDFRGEANGSGLALRSSLESLTP